MISISQFAEFEKTIRKEDAVFAYFSHQKCGVCKTLKPKLATALKNKFPLLKQVYVDIEKAPEIAGQYRIFTVPVIIVFFTGKESYRKARNIGVAELTELINRPYSLLFK